MVVGALPPNDHRGQAMHPSISLTPDERNTLLDYYRAPFYDPALRLRAHIILLLAQGYPWATIAAVLFCSTRTIDRWQKRFAHGRVDALCGQTRGRRSRFAQRFADLVVFWLTQLTPRTFGYLRSRWSCALLALVLWHRCHLVVSRETVRRWLHQADIVWRRPRPVLDRRDPNREEVLGKLRALLRDLPDDETAVFEDEVDINLNPEIGFMWMRRGQQAEVVTPGDNEKKYLAGSLHWRTGALIGPVTAPRRNGQLMAAHLEELARRLRRYKKIHVLCDNARFHKCAAVDNVLREHAGRLVLHYLPRYAPECNPVERVWWHLREEITRNHRCRTMAELVDLVFRWLEGRERFVVEDKVYHEEAPAVPGAKAA
jgi:putative transposase